MKVSGFTIVRKGIEYGYPFVEAIQSILPLCDELVVNYGISTDATLERLRAIDSPKIKIIEREWDMSGREGGRVLAVETNVALDRCTGDWCFYIQADEIVHEKDYNTIRAAMMKELHNDEVEGLEFGYKHFYGSYDYIQDNFRLWYIRETRVIKNGRSIRSWGDAMGFKHADSTPIRRKRIGAHIYHYGWVRPPEVMKVKKKNFERLYHDDGEVARKNMSENVYTHLGHLLRFDRTHPVVMKDRVEKFNWDFDPHVEKQLPDWLRYIILFLEPLTKRLRRYLG